MKFVHQALNEVGWGALPVIGYIGLTGNLLLNTDEALRAAAA